jgi:GNAT superfamily N-acetyltransferase
VEVVRPLRHSVLRPGRPFATVCTPRDEDAATWHLAAFAAGEVVGVVTLFADATPYAKGRRAERFRWMAVDPAWQGRGVGRLLMRSAAEFLGERGVAVMWAHGRDSALSFYEGIGFASVGDGFIDPDTGIGHHIVIAEVAALRV